MITVILGSCFFLIDWLSFGYSETERERVRFKLNVEGQGGERILDVDGQGGVGGLENWTNFMDIICVLSLSFFFLSFGEGKVMRMMTAILKYCFIFTQIL